MAAKCVFLDRDRTIIEDPGYLTDPEAVKLLPGVELALRSLADAGFKLVVVTNQSAVARGMITEDGLERIHEEMRRQLSERDVVLDGIYHCPYHPDGAVEEFARESVDRKPQPGMLLRAAKELELDLAHSWMVGDSPRDVEAGQRAGCRTVRVRPAAEEAPQGQPMRDTKHIDASQDEDAQADFTVRNLVDAARVIVRESLGEPDAAAGQFDVAGAKAAGAAAGAARPGGAPPAEGPDLAAMNDSQLLREIARQLRESNIARHDTDFSVTRLVACLFQMLALLALIWGAVHLPGVTAQDAAAAADRLIVVHVCMLTAIALQLAALTFFFLSRRR